MNKVMTLIRKEVLEDVEGSMVMQIPYRTRAKETESGLKTYIIAEDGKRAAVKTEYDEDAYKVVWNADALGFYVIEYEAAKKVYDQEMAQYEQDLKEYENGNEAYGDYLKAQEAQQKRDDENFKKSPQDDLINMQTGLYGYKGAIHFQTAACINDELEEIRSRNLPKTEVYTVIAELIDKYIHQNYRLYPGNYIAHDLLYNKVEFADKYTTEEKAIFNQYIEGQLAKISIPNKDEAFLRECIWAMYANPVTNHLKAING